MGIRKRHARKVCPKTGRRIDGGRKYWWLAWVFPVAGLVSLIWFLLRVIPKPSRATYPCQRFAAPVAGGFVVWLAGIVGSTLIFAATYLIINLIIDLIYFMVDPRIKHPGRKG